MQGFAEVLITLAMQMALIKAVVVAKAKVKAAKVDGW